MTQSAVLSEVALNDISKMEGKFLTFLVEKELFGMPIADVVQIVGIQEITSVPEFPHYAKGIINLRGSIIPVIDIRLRIGKPERAYDERTCIIVTLIQDNLIGFIVDQVDQVTDISDESISALPVLEGDNRNSYLTGIATHQGAVILLLSIGLILSIGDINAVINQKAEALG